MSMFINDWSLVTIQGLLSLWEGILTFLPTLVGALVIFVIGWYISLGIAKAVTEILKKLKFNQFFEKGGWREALERAEIKVDAAVFVGAIFKWVFTIVFLLIAVDILGLSQFAIFLNRILGYLPNVIVAVLIFVVTVVLVDIVEKIVRAAVEGTRVGYGRLVSAIVKWSMWVFATLAILRQLVIVPGLIDTVFNALIYGLVAFFVISLGIAFGLGGKEVAAEILRDMKTKMQK